MRPSRKILALTLAMLRLLAGAILAEGLLFKPDGGIIAGIVPTGVSMSNAQSESMNALFAELFDQPTPTLGEALTRAKRGLAADAPEIHEVIQTFVLLGDPALG